MKVSTLVTALIATGTTLVSAKRPHPTANGRARVPGGYIFELDTAEDVSAFYSDVEDHGETRMKLDYKLFKGVSIQLTDLDTADDKAMKMAASPVVLNMWPLYVYSIPKPTIELIGAPKIKTIIEKRQEDGGGNGTVGGFSPHIMTQVDKLHKKGITGKGIKIAVIDTGIDYTHPALGDGCFGPGCVVAFGTDLVGDNYSGFNMPVPDDDPMDCQGHGSHVAGIVAARENQYGFVGAAPEATLGAYRVFGCDGSAANDVLIAAYNQAFEDGADIITASIGGPSGWSEEPWAVAVSRIVDQGVPCTVSAGNEGATGQFFASTASNGKGVTSIASFDNTLTPTLLTVSNFTVDGGDDEEFGYTPGSPDEWDDVKLALWSASDDATDPSAGCTAYPDDTPDLSDKIVLIRRGTCTFVIKAQNAAAHGAKYIMFFNNLDAGTLAVDVSSVEGIQGAGMVTAEQGVAWLKLLNAGSEVVLDIVDSDDPDADISIIYPENEATGGGLSTFTTWGPTFEGDVKPQFGSPGGSILSTYPVAKGAYAVLSGTSMACPLVAGVMALLGEVRGTFDPTELESALSAYSHAQLFNDGGSFYEFLAPVQQQGAGLIQAYDAAYASVLLTPSSLAFNDSDNAIEVLNFTLQNTGKEELSFEITNVPTLTFYTLGEDEYPLGFPSEPVENAATLKFSEGKVTVGAGESVTVEVMPAAPAGLEGARLPVWSGYVAVNGSDGTNLAIPYQGIAGSLHEATVLLGDDFTWITKSNDQDAVPVAPNTTFSIPPAGSPIDAEKTVLPAIGLDMAMGSPSIRVSVIPLTTCPPKGTHDYKGHKVLGQIEGSPFPYAPRQLNVFPWNGKLANGETAPAGKYKFVVHALHIFGDPTDEKDLWDEAESPAFRIKYTE